MKNQSKSQPEDSIQTDSDVDREVNRVQKTKVLITLAFIVALAALALQFNGEDGIYLIGLKADPGCEWILEEIHPEGVVRLISSYSKEDTYYFEFQGIQTGKVDVSFLHIQDSNQENPADNRIYELRVDDELMIAQGKISRN